MCVCVLFFLVGGVGGGSHQGNNLDFSFFFFLFLSASSIIRLGHGLTSTSVCGCESILC